MADQRPLTIGEIGAARRIFGTAINYAIVVVHRGKYIFFQPDDTAMTPNGQIYFPTPVYKDDFSTNPRDASWIIHELTHVWQYHQGVNLILAAPFSRNYHYGALTSTTNFSALNIEQQAAVVADYYLRTQHYATINGSGAIGDYRTVIPFRP